jgi:hypothetical protein
MELSLPPLISALKGASPDWLPKRQHVKKTSYKEESSRPPREAGAELHCCYRTMRAF